MTVNNNLDGKHKVKTIPAESPAVFRIPEILVRTQILFKIITDLDRIRPLFNAQKEIPNAQILLLVTNYLIKL
jgi:hypothetical protein